MEAWIALHGWIDVDKGSSDDLGALLLDHLKSSMELTSSLGPVIYNQHPITGSKGIGCDLKGLRLSRIICEGDGASLPCQQAGLSEEHQPRSKFLGYSTSEGETHSLQTRNLYHSLRPEWIRHLEHGLAEGLRTAE